MSRFHNTKVIGIEGSQSGFSENQNFYRMKKRSFRNLQLNKTSISDLQLIKGGTEDQEDQAPVGDGPAPAPVAILSIGHACSLRNSCARVCSSCENTTL